MINGMSVLAVIPARGGSKRVPRKNIRSVAGKPLIAWTIEAALKSNLLDVVLVSTDDEKIAQVSREFGADVPFIRSPELATDTTTANDVVMDVMQRLEGDGKKFDYIMLLQPTSPLRNASMIDEAIMLAASKKAKGVISVTQFTHPLEWINSLPEDRSMDGFIAQANKSKRSQDYEKKYMLNGAIYMVAWDDFYKENSLFLRSGQYAYVMAEESSIDIDTEYDIRLAEVALRGIVDG